MHAARLLSIGLGLSVALSFALPHAPTLAQSAPTERVTMVVEVLEREERPTIPCGQMGLQPRDVTARVVSVEEGTFEGERILLSWPVCSLESIVIGQRYRIQIRRWVGRPTAADTRYRVRRSTPL